MADLSATQLPSGPFVLLDDARIADAAPARLYADPVAILTAEDADGVTRLFDDLRAAGREGLHAAGYLSYEAGYALEPRLRHLLGRPNTGRLAWFGLFADCRIIAADAVPALLDSAPTPLLADAAPAIAEADYAERFAAIHAAILAGDIYQANLTFQNSARFGGDPVALYAALRARSAAGHGGLIHDGADWILSLSPELFFAMQAGRLTARPMKGTAVRTADAGTDAASVAALAGSAKDRAENLMIVDLLRNDLARVAVPGSVAVDRLFAIESYPTVHQMTSRVTACIAPARDAIDVLRALFPCGSITGAPKIRAMELIAATETRPRGVYCGAIGRIDPPSPDKGGAGYAGDAAFNVAIRTLHFRPADRKLSFGLGSGVVADSRSGAEWRECLAKGAFVDQLARRFDLIETMRFDPASGIARLETHLARLKDSAAALGFECDRHAARNALNAACFALEAPSRVRLKLAPGGAMAIEMRAAPAAPTAPIGLVVRPLPVAPDDPRLRHKTSDRGFYDNARAAARADCGADEVVFQAPDGRITEGSFTHVFIARGDRLLTPPLTVGLLPGVLRADLIAAGEAEEAEIGMADLEQADRDGTLRLGNALRGLMPARLVRQDA